MGSQAGDHTNVPGDIGTPGSRTVARMAGSSWPPRVVLAVHDPGDRGTGQAERAADRRRRIPGCVGGQDRPVRSRRSDCIQSGLQRAAFPSVSPPQMPDVIRLLRAYSRHGSRAGHAARPAARARPSRRAREEQVKVRAVARCLLPPARGETRWGSPRLRTSAGGPSRAGAVALAPAGRRRKRPGRPHPGRWPRTPLRTAGDSGGWSCGRRGIPRCAVASRRSPAAVLSRGILRAAARAARRLGNRRPSQFRSVRGAAVAG